MRGDKHLANLEPPADVWLNLYPNDPNQNQTTRRRCISYDVSLKVLAVLHPGIYSGQNVEKMSEKDFSTLYDAFAKGVEYELAALRLFYRGIVSGNRLGLWSLPVPFLSFLVNREKNLVSVDDFERNFGPCQKVAAAFLESLEKKSFAESKHDLARILLSSILFGGLVDGVWVQPWIDSLEERMYLVGNVLWFDLWRKKKSAPKGRKKDLGGLWSMRKRWVADPLSHLLLIRWIKNGGRDKISGETFKAWSILNPYLSELLSDKQTRPKSMNQLLRWARAGLTMRVPPYLRTFAAGGFHSTQLPDEAWLRLLVGRNILVPKPERAKPKRLLSNQSLLEIPKDLAPSADQLDLLNKFKELFPQDSDETFVDEEIENYFNLNFHKMGQPLWLLCSWAQFLLTGPAEDTCHFHRASLVPSSVRRYLDSIGVPLISVLEDDEDLMEMDQVELEELYDAVSEYHNGTTESSYCLTPLASFHWFLCHLRGETDEELFVNLRRNSDVVPSVDANILLPKEYERAKRYLGEGSENLPRHRQPALLALILGYRCALRRNELAGLRIGDVELGPMGMLKIRAYKRKVEKKKHRLKRKGSARSICLWVFLSPAELKLLYDWQEKRLAETQTEIRSLLFSEQETPNKKLNPELLFKPVTEVLKTVTDDQTFRYHHLRRSCAQSLLWCLEPQVEDLPLLPTDSALAKRLLGSSFLGRSSLFAVCNHLGHSSPDVTVRSYLHHLDLMLGRALANPSALPVLSPKAISNVTKKSIQAVYNSMDETKKCPPLTYWIRIHRDLEKILSPPLLEKSLKPKWSRRVAKSTKFQLPEWEDVISSFYASRAGGELVSCILPIKSQRQLLLVEKLYQALRDMTPVRQRMVMEQLAIAWNKYDWKKKIFEYESPDELKLFLQALERLGLAHTAVVEVFLCLKNYGRKSLWERVGNKGPWSLKVSVMPASKARSRKEIIHVKITAALEQKDNGNIVNESAISSMGFVMFLMVLEVSQERELMNTDSPVD